MTREYHVVEEIVREAGNYIKGKFEKDVTINFKGKIDLVTEVDRRSEEIITRGIKRAFPGDVILAEESGRTREGTSDRLWLVDPLDGTTNFAHAYPFVAVSVALQVKEEVIYGVVYDPLREEFFRAELLAEATLNGVPIHSSRNADLSTSLLSTGFPYDIQENHEGYMETLERILMHTQGIRRDGSAALDLCYVASGRCDGFYERKLQPWDTAAGKLIVEESGGRVTTFRGGPYSIYGDEILATNGLIHDAVIRILNGK
jgi:myo-inositol-1(or 4)-monophosphatase